MQSSTVSGTVTIGGVDFTLVFFDLEATGLDTTVCEIVQIAAVTQSQTFNVHTVPRRAMTETASRITGFTVQGETLLHHGRTVPTVPLRQALESFITFLHSFERPLLVAHGGRRFDCPLLARVLREFSLKDKFEQVVHGFLDTFWICKALFSNSGEIRKFSQEFLVRHFLNKSYEAHNALEDCRALEELYHKWSPSPSVLLKHKFTLNDPLYPAENYTSNRRPTRRFY